MNMKSLSSKNIEDKINFRKITKLAKSNYKNPYKDPKRPITVIIKNSNEYDNDYLDFIYNLYNFKYQNGNFGWRYITTKRIYYSPEKRYITESERIYYSPEKGYNNMKQVSKYLQTNFKYKNGNFDLRYITETRLVRSSSGRIKKNIKDIIIRNKNNLKSLIIFK